MPRPTKMKNP